MAKLRWTTPDEAPGEEKRFGVYIPSGLAYEAALRGALLLLCSPSNWEQVGEQTPETVARAYELSVIKTFQNWGECSIVDKIPGEIFAFGGAGDVAGALYCDGAEVSQEAYPALYAAIGNTWGSAGAGNFLLPNLKSRYLVGTGQIPGGQLRLLADIGGQEEQDVPPAAAPIHHHHLTMSSVSINSAPVGTPVTVLRPSGTTSTDDAGEGLDALLMDPPYAAVRWFIWTG